MAEAIAAALMILVKAVRAYALENYETGAWDVVVECWEDAQIAEVLTDEGCTTVDEAIAAMQEIMDPFAAYREDIQNTAF